MKNWFKKIFKHPLTYILLFAFAIRMAMIKYGLPFWLYNDEPPFVLAALKMLQLKTIFPFLHEEAFKPFFYYPPYIAYLFLPFFVLIAGVSYLNSGLSMIDFQNTIAADPSIFFLTGRFITIILSLVVIYLIYKTTFNISKDRFSGLSAAFLSSTSLMIISLSVTAKHWLPILFFYTLAFFILTHPKLNLQKRLLLSALVTGIGIGVSTIVILFSIIMVLWYLFEEKKTIRELFMDLDMYLAAIVIIILFFVPIFLYPASLGFAPDMTLHDLKTLGGFLVNPILFILPLINTESVLSFLFILGLILGYRKYKSFFVTSIIFIIIYSLVFYTFFRNEYRFILPLTLFFTIGAGLSIKELRLILPKKLFVTVASIFFIFLLLISVRMSYLGFQNDSRVKAKNWLEANAKNNEKVIVYANLMRLPNNVGGITEQEHLDPNSLRTNDKSELKIDPKNRKEKVFHALNLYTVSNENFYNDISNYAKKNQYKYLVLSKEDFLNKPVQFFQVESLSVGAKLVASYGNNVSSYSLSKTEIGPTLSPLFKIKEFGPEIKIYDLIP